MTHKNMVRSDSRTKCIAVCPEVNLDGKWGRLLQRCKPAIAGTVQESQFEKLHLQLEVFNDSSQKRNVKFERELSTF